MDQGTHKIEREQARKAVAAALPAIAFRTPKMGWIHTLRTALGMSGAALGRRMGASRFAAANLEKSEQEGRITLRSMREAAAAMNGHLVYAIVPAGVNSVEALIEAQAERKARQMVASAATHMALEAQKLDDEATQAEILRLKQELLHTLPRDFWDDEPVGEAGTD